MLTMRYLELTISLVVLTFPITVDCDLTRDRAIRHTVKRRQVSEAIKSPSSTNQHSEDLCSRSREEAAARDRSCLKNLIVRPGDINGSPVYTVDGRFKNQIEEAEHFKSSELGDRALVDVKSLPISLTIDPVMSTDEGLYFCRIDFKWARTASTSIKLNVQVPPSKLAITNVNGIPFRKFAGPFNQGETALIKCIASGGKPPPSLIWYQDDKIIDNSYNISEKLTLVENVLSLNNLERDQLFEELKCKSNHEAYGTSMATVKLEINLKPLSVKISSLQSIHKAGLKSQFTCTTHGSRPPAIISWYLNNRTLPYSRESYSEDGNYSSSTLELTNSRSLDGSTLYCQAVNKRLSGSTLQDELKLNIKYAPVCKDNQRLNYPASIGELIDITCEIYANPDQVTFIWTKKYNETLYSTLKRQQHQSSVTTTTATTTSTVSTTTISSASAELMIGTTATIVATPQSAPNVAQTKGPKIEQHQPNVIKSVLQVNVESTSDFAEYTCKPENMMGTALEPCLFTIQPQDPPAKPKYCSIMEQQRAGQHEYLSVDCIPDQASSPVDYYILEVYLDDGHHSNDNSDNHHNGQLPLLDQVNQTGLPVFQLTNLELTNGSYILVAYAVNAIGKSSELIIPLRRAKSTSSHLHVPNVKESSLEKGPISPNMFGTLSILLALISFIILSIVCLLIILIRCKLNKKQDNQKNQQQQQQLTTETPTSANPGDMENKVTCESNQTPDVIPFKEPDLDDIKESFKTGAIVIPEAFLTEAYIQFHGEIIDNSPSMKIGENIAMITNCAQESYRSTPV